METARRIKDVLADQSFIFRAGAWKPRTSPNTFQGVGEKALSWLQEVKASYGIDVATEVATPEHVKLALEAGMDYLWIGARTSANPIAVENLTQREFYDRPQDARSSGALHSSREGGRIKGILIKNPVNADSGLWLGNIERLEKTGVPVIAVHRGCNHQPCWGMAHAVRKARPDIPMLLDPSHMSGDAAKVPALLSKVDELGLDGAMIEVHYRPEEALSDAKQQIRPAELTENLSPKRVLRPSTGRSIERSSSLLKRGSQDTELNWLRAEIDELDESLWTTIAARMDVSKRIGEWKKEHGVAPLQPQRYQEILNKLTIKNEELKKDGIVLSEEFMKNVWELIHEESLRQQI